MLPPKDHLDLPPFLAARGQVRLPGSKSISIRALLLAALAEGETRLTNLLDSDDTKVMREALAQLGVAMRQEDDDIVIQGTRRFPKSEADIFVGNSGLSARSLVAVLALTGGAYRIHGVPRMHERPIGDLVDALNAAGASIGYEAQQGYPPLLIGQANIDPTKPFHVRGDVSSQFLTGILQSAPLLSERSQVAIEVEGELISKPYIEITRKMMAQFGVTVEREDWRRFTIAARSHYRAPGEFEVEGDASAASYFLAAGAIGGGPVRITGAGRSSIQGDVRFADALEAMGAQVTWGDNWIEAQAPSSGRLNAIQIDLNHIPDAAMTLGVCALFAEGITVLRNIGSWRVKETDRLAAMATELRKTGAEVEEGADYLSITPPATLTPNAAIDTYDDHRIAMCFSLLAVGGVPVRINEPRCVAKTFPDYFNVLAQLNSRTLP
ncbi:MAG TPA: 3-phosphoshikimate 1-carboxyvinyltransferase [Bryobacteraceae bacterium]